MSDLGNISAVARREYTVRVRTRSFVFGTLILLVAVLAIAFVPIIVEAMDQGDAQRIAVHVGATGLGGDPVASLNLQLNAATDTGETTTPQAPDYVVSSVPDLVAARQAVGAGDYAAVLDVGRSASGDLVFVLYTNDNAAGRTAGLIRQASTAIAVADRLARVGVAPSEQANLFAPTQFGVAWPDPAKTGPTRGSSEMIGQDMLGFGMTILIFMMIILYGTWIAQSVVDEKASRVMEVILNAATPFQLLTGKVLGVGAVAGTQYVALVLTGAVALLVQGQVATVVLGGSGAAAGLPQGLTIGILLMLGLYGTLGFLLFAVLYAAAGSLVSRQEDVNSVVMPMTLVSTAGYMIGVYAAMGLLNIKEGWIVALSQVPLVSPFMMLGRITSGEAMAWEVPLSLVLLVLAIFGALWLAARIYAAGVLLYGQRPSVRAVLHLVRTGT
jgi:ABC-2 type transport system permease protein